MWSRRNLLARAAAWPWLACSARGSGAPADIIAGIERETLFHGRDGGTTWFSTRACAVPSPGRPRVLMLMAPITGSDYFGPVHATETSDLGKTWSQPAPVPGLGRIPRQGSIEETVCDMVPEYHAPTRTVLAMGHNVFYRGNKFFRDQPPRQAVYIVRGEDGRWTGLKKLRWDDPRGGHIYTCNCAQRVTLPGGDVLVPLSFGPGQAARSASTLRCGFDGRELVIRSVGTELRNDKGRGLLEPSIAKFQERFFLTLRAEDERGYVSASSDGLDWAPQAPWTWDDGEPVPMSTTQQRWLVHSDALYLVYTRRTEENQKVMRWRSPLFAALVDPARPCLVRATERVVLPLTGDPINKPQEVPHLGNFHVQPVTPEESWVTVGAVATTTWRGDVLLARVRWKTPNRAASA